MSRDKRRRFGRVRQLPSGRWQARYPGPDGKLRAAPYTFERERDADRWLGEVETDMSRGDWSDPDAAKIPLGVYAKAWVEERPRLGVRTVELYSGLLRNHIDPYIGHVVLSELSPARVRRWRKELIDANTGAVTVAKAYRFLRAVLNTAVQDRLLKLNPCNIPRRARRTARNVRSPPWSRRSRLPTRSNLGTAWWCSWRRLRASGSPK